MADYLALARHPCRARRGCRYPHKFHVSTSLAAFRKKYDGLKDSETSADEVSIAGRINLVRVSSKKLIFYTIQGEGLELQVMAEFSQHDASMGPEFSEVHSSLRRCRMHSITRDLLSGGHSSGDDAVPVGAVLTRPPAAR